jgi:dTDP-4-dehydrorhamnose reductase
VAGEVATRTASDHVIVRTSWLFGGGGPNFVRTIAARLHDGGGIRVVADQTGRPTYAKDLAHAIGRLLADRAAPGTYHVANSENATWFEFAREIARQLSSAQEITPCTTAEMRRPAKRPGYSVLDTTKTDRLIGPLRSWRPALAEAIQTEDY